jgi:hypothetical protein
MGQICLPRVSHYILAIISFKFLQISPLPEVTFYSLTSISAVTTIKPMLKNIGFYTVAGTVIAIISQAFGADWMVTLFLSLLVPPIILLIIFVFRYKGML